MKNRDPKDVTISDIEYEKNVKNTFYYFNEKIKEKTSVLIEERLLKNSSKRFKKLIFE